MIVFLAVVLLFGCSSRLKTPTAYVRPASQMLSTRATLKDAEAAKPVLYYHSHDPKTWEYEIEYIAPVGKIPFLVKFKPRTTLKDTVRSAPCYVRVRALGHKTSKWSKLIYVD